MIMGHEHEFSPIVRDLKINDLEMPGKSNCKSGQLQQKVKILYHGKETQNMTNYEDRIKEVLKLLESNKEKYL